MGEKSPSPLPYGCTGTQMRGDEMRREILFLPPLCERKEKNEIEHKEGNILLPLMRQAHPRENVERETRKFLEIEGEGWRMNSHTCMRKRGKRRREEREDEMKKEKEEKEKKNFEKIRREEDGERR